MKTKLHTRKKSLTNKKFFLSSKPFIIILILFCLILIELLWFASPGRSGSKLYSFSESVITLSDNWILTNSSGESNDIQLPYTIEYGSDGVYTLTGVLPENSDMIEAPVFCFYSNYTDLTITLDGKPLCIYPENPTMSSGATGNTYHFVRLPADYEGKTITISLTCQLGNKITYLIKAPLVGSKATMLYTAIIKSLPSILLSGCMLVLAVVLTVLYFSLKQKLKLNCSTAYISIFATLFAAYVFCETYFAQLIIPNSYVLFTCTLMLLALLPIPLVGLFSEDVSSKFKGVPNSLIVLCSANFIGQIILNYTGILSFRVMLPATHIIIVISIAIMSVCLFLSDKNEKPKARKKLQFAVPMIAGGLLDILLLIINKPSFNNSLWFTLGVTSFIVIQFCSFVYKFFITYRTVYEAKVLKEMAYRDSLTNTGNRNAYEKKLKEITNKELSEQLCCIVVDINDLKRINDNYGHAAGDIAIVETSKILNESTPSTASCFRTGGDEFVVLLNGFDEKKLESLANELSAKALTWGKENSLPLNLAVGSGCYTSSDKNLLSFIQRVDSAMYCQKRAIKQAPWYPFKQV